MLGSPGARGEIFDVQFSISHFTSAKHQQGIDPVVIPNHQRFHTHLVILHPSPERPHVPPDALVLDADARRRHGVELRPQRPHDAPEQLLRAVEALDDTAQAPHGMRRELEMARFPA